MTAARPAGGDRDESLRQRLLHLREGLLVAGHNAYHLGELAAVRRLPGAWSS